MSDFKPEDYPSLSPHLLVPDSDAVVDFAATVLHAVRLRRITREDSSVAHAEVGIDDSLLMVGGDPDSADRTRALVHLYVRDVDDTYRRALGYGAEAVQPPRQGDDPDRRAGVRFPASVEWWFATMQPGAASG